MWWAIPSFRLPVEVVSRELSKLEKLGVSFRYGTKITSNKDLERLEAEFEAVIFATGLGADRRLGVAGENLREVQQQAVHAYTYINVWTRFRNLPLSRSCLALGSGVKLLPKAGTTSLNGYLETAQQIIAENDLASPDPDRLSLIEG
jgi:hypothetical protein